MTLTLDNQIIRVAEYLDDTGYGRWTLALITKYINDAQRDFARAAKICRKQSAALASSSTTPTYAWYTLPTDLLEIEAVWDYSSSPSMELTPVTATTIGSNWETLTGGRPLYYLPLLDFGLTELRVWPYPTSALTALKLNYTYLPADLVPSWAASTAYVVGDARVNGANVYTCITAGTSASSGGPTGTTSNIVDGTAHWSYTSATGATVSTSPIPEQYHMALVYYAVAMCLMGFKQGSDPARSQIFMGMYERDLDDARVRVSRRFSSAPAYVRYGSV